MTDPTTSAPTSALRAVNGVFKGGGAKGIAYAGALTAMRDRGLWFHSVAGASAGAITASLIASGMDPDELAAAVPKGLAAMQSSLPQRVAKAVLGQATSVFESKGLRAWLDGVLAERIGKTDGTPVTFEELFESKGIELYVVAMDLSNGLPVVFCRRTTPTVEVAGAVAASSAIPGAFPPGRGVFHSDEDGTVVHQFVDGGTWANYPSFVFQDRSFRAWLRAATEARGRWAAEDDEAWRQEEARPVIGFILGSPTPLEHRQAAGLVPLKGRDVNRRFDQGPTYTSPKRVNYLLGALLSSDWARLIIGIAMAVWVTLSLVTLPIGVRRFSTWLADWSPDWFYPLALVGTLSLVVLASVVAIGLVVALVLVGRIIADTLIPSVQALIGVPTRVAPWIGLGEDSIVLRVPHEGLKTTEFNVSPAARQTAIDDAHASVLAQLDDATTAARLDCLFGGGTQAPPLQLGKPSPLPVVSPDRVSVDGVVAAVVATAVIGGVGWWGTNSAGTDGIGRIILSVAVGLVAGGAALWYVGGRAGTRSATRARFGVRGAAARSTVFANVVIAVGVAAVIGGGVLSWSAMHDRAEDTVQAKVLSAQSNTLPDLSQNAYTVQADGIPEPLQMVTTRHLRLGERVFVAIDSAPSRARLVGPLDDGRFALAVVLWMVGLGALTSGVRQRRWITRCHRLGTLVNGWQSPAAPEAARP